MTKSEANCRYIKYLGDTAIHHRSADFMFAISWVAKVLSDNDIKTFEDAKERYIWSIENASDNPTVFEMTKKSANCLVDILDDAFNMDLENYLYKV